MLIGISLTDFKNFHDTTLILGHLTLLVGTNAAGKSNIRDAFRLLATTHSPQLLRLLSPKSLEYAALLYRLPERMDAKIKRILSLPEAERIIQEQNLANLHESGWLEDMVYFMEDEETGE